MNKEKFYKFTNIYGVGFKKVTFDGVYNHWERMIDKNKTFLGWKPRFAVDEGTHEAILLRGWVECDEQETKNTFNQY